MYHHVPPCSLHFAGDGTQGFVHAIHTAYILHALLIPGLCLGRSYDEKVDVFSFGIVLCEVGHVSKLLWLCSTLQPSHALAWMSTDRGLRPWEHCSPNPEHGISGRSCP